MPFFILSLLISCSSVMAEPPAHEQAPAKPNSAKTSTKWTSDRPLRTNMAQIRTAVEAKAPGVQAGKISAGDYDQLATQIDNSVKTIFKECKLPADADAALHHVLGEIMAGSAAMRGETAGKREGFQRVQNGLKAYGERFIDQP